jgi:hypothetical protein
MNPFILFDETPRPYLDAEALKTKFLKLSAPIHPDRVHHLSEDKKKEANKQFSELNAAYLLLREHRDRMNLLFELVAGSKPKVVQQIPEDMADLFMEVGKVCQEADSYLTSRDTAETSPLLKAMSSRKKSESLSRLQEVQSKVDMKTAGHLDLLKKLDAEWIATQDHAEQLGNLERLARLFSYTGRWSQQINERMVQLKIG